MRMLVESGVRYWHAASLICVRELTDSHRLLFPNTIRILSKREPFSCSAADVQIA